MEQSEEEYLAELADATAKFQQIREWQNLFRTNLFHKELELHIPKPLYIDVSRDCPIDDFGIMTVGEWGGWYLTMDASFPKPRLILVPIRAPLSRDYSWSFSSETVLIRAAFNWNPEKEGSPADYLQFFPNACRLAGEQEQDCRLRKPLWLLRTL